MRNSEPTFGLTLVGGGPMASPPMAGEVGAIAEDLGFSALWVPEHVLIPSIYESRYPYSEDGRLRGSTDSRAASPDPLVWLAYVAARTSRIRLGTGIFVLPQRNPFVVAQQVATLDRLSEGRVSFGIGTGWLKEEFDALGVSFHNRGHRTDEYIALLRTLWAADRPVTFHGDFVAIDECSSSPSPVQPGGIPILIGGDSPVAARRAGRIGDGWFPGKGTPDELAPLVDLLHQAAADAGRDPNTILCQTGYPKDDKTLTGLLELGFSHFTVGVSSPTLFETGGLERRLRDLATRVGL